MASKEQRTSSVRRAQEARARELHEESIVFFCHDHEIRRAELELMRSGGITAKQLHISLDSRLWGTREEFMSSVADALPSHEFNKWFPGYDAADLAAIKATPEEAFLGWALVALDHIHRLCDQSDGTFAVAEKPRDIFQAKEDGSHRIVLGSEGSRLIKGGTAVLRCLYRLGLRHLELTWATRTALGAPQSDASGEGLTPIGADVVREMNDLGMIVDVSHLAYASIIDVLEISRAPVLNSHTGALALNPGQPQLLPDDLIRETAKRGGVLAVHFISHLVKPGHHQATLEELLDQFEYLCGLAGTDHVACGPDYLFGGGSRPWDNTGAPPFTAAAGVEDAGRMLNLTRGLVERGFSDSDIKDILGLNLLRLWQAVEDAASGTADGSAPVTEGETGVLTGGTTPL